MRRAYLDSSIIVSAVIDDDMKPDAKRILSRIPQSYDEIIIPQIVLGEAFIQIFRKSQEKLAVNMTRFYECILETVRNPHQHTPSLSRDILVLAKKIRDEENDYNLDYNDIVLTAYAIADEKATALYTFDNGIHESVVIQKTIEEYGDRLSILDRVP